MAQKTSVLSVRISPADRELISARAREARLSQSEYILRAALGEAPAPDAEGIVEEQRRIRLDLTECFDRLDALESREAPVPLQVPDVEPLAARVAELERLVGLLQEWVPR